MKKGTFTRLIILGLLAFGVGQFAATAQTLDTGTGTGWGNIPIGTSLLLNENFKGYDFFHTDNNANEGNSDNVIDAVSGDPVYGYTSFQITKNYLGHDAGAKFTFEQCAFAPEWKSAYATRDTAENTLGVSDGFVEISREYPASGGNLPTIRGYMTVDLSNIQFVEAIQYSHSSTGGNKRGLLVEFSVDAGASWDTLRYQPGNAWSNSFTNSVSSGVKTMNGYRCDPSSYGMLWEDVIYANGVPFKLRFSEAGGQTPRIHDLRVYGMNVVAGVEDNVIDAIEIDYSNSVLSFSVSSDVIIYTAQGVIVKSATSVSELSISDLPAGMYVVNANVDGKSVVKKILK